MGFLSKIKGFFKEENQKDAKEINLLNPNNSQIEEVKSQEPKRYIEQKCEICQGIIGEDHWSKFQGRFFHKSCARKKKREVLNGQGVKW